MTVYVDRAARKKNVRNKFGAHDQYLRGKRCKYPCLEPMRPILIMGLMDYNNVQYASYQRACSFPSNKIQKYRMLHFGVYH
jgi:hypothetical protein